MKIAPAVFFFLLFVVAIAIPPMVLQYTGNTDLLTNGFWTLFFFMSGLTLLVLIGMLYIKQINQEYFAQAFLAGTTFKILACLVFILVFLAKHTVNKPVFVAGFMYIYILNTVFEIYALLRNLRNQNSR